jgi:predicted ATPase
LRAALDWSYRLLSARERALLASLGALSGPFDVAAAGSASGQADAAVVLERLTELANQSVIEVIPGATPRFHLLLTVREYALARAEAEADAEADPADKVRRHGSVSPAPVT